MSSILVGNRDGVNYCYMPCPYDRKAEIRLTYKQRKGAKQEPIRIDSKIYYSDQNAMLPPKVNFTQSGTARSIRRKAVITRLPN